MFHRDSGGYRSLGGEFVRERNPPEADDLPCKYTKMMYFSRKYNNILST